MRDGRAVRWSGNLGRCVGGRPAPALSCAHLTARGRAPGRDGAGDGDHRQPSRLARVAGPPVDERRRADMPTLRLPHGRGETAAVEHLPQMPRMRAIHPTKLKGPGFPGPSCYFFLFGRCVSADPAAVLAFLDAAGLLSTLLAAVPAFFPVVSFLVMTCPRNTPPIAASEDASDRGHVARCRRASGVRSLAPLHRGPGGYHPATPNSGRATASA